MAKIIDLSKPIQFSKSDPFFMRIKIKHKPHKKSNLLIRYFLGLPAKLFPKNFIGWADDTITHMGVHAATHIDAPWHYSPTCKGEKAKTIEQMPLELCYADGVVIDVQHKQDFEMITVADIEQSLIKSNSILKAHDIVLICTGRDSYLGTDDYVNKGVGMSREATEWLLKKGIKVIGIDQWGFDLPLRYMAKEAKRTNNADFFWQAHLVGQEYEYYHIEQMVNIKSLPSHGFKVSVLPLPIVGASAAPARVVAIFE